MGVVDDWWSGKLGQSADGCKARVRLAVSLDLTIALRVSTVSHFMRGRPSGTPSPRQLSDPPRVTVYAQTGGTAHLEEETMTEHRLSSQQLQFFDTFGFLKFPGLFAFTCAVNVKPFGYPASASNRFAFSGLYVKSSCTDGGIFSSGSK